MSRDATISLVFAGDERTFRIAIDNLFALQDACDSGPQEILRRLSDGTWRLRDVIEPHRIGLIGAGVEARIAKRMVDENIVPGRIAEHVLSAQAIVATALVGDPREPVGKEGAATDVTEANAFPPPRSMEPGQP